MKLTLGTDSQARKDTPLVAGYDNYFPAAEAGVARHSKRSNDKHNPGEPMHWSRGKSSDHAECIRRHGADIQDLEAWLDRNPDHADREAVITMLEHEHDALAWRAHAKSQEFYEKWRGAPLAPAARLPAAHSTRQPSGLGGRNIPVGRFSADGTQRRRTRGSRAVRKDRKAASTR